MALLLGVAAMQIDLETGSHMQGPRRFALTAGSARPRRTRRRSRGSDCRMHRTARRGSGCGGIKVLAGSTAAGPASGRPPSRAATQPRHSRAQRPAATLPRTLALLLANQAGARHWPSQDTWPVEVGHWTGRRSARQRASQLHRQRLPARLPPPCCHRASDGTRAPAGQCWQVQPRTPLWQRGRGRGQGQRASGPAGLLGRRRLPGTDAGTRRPTWQVLPNRQRFPQRPQLEVVVKYDATRQARSHHQVPRGHTQRPRSQTCPPGQRWPHCGCRQGWEGCGRGRTVRRSGRHAWARAVRAGAQPRARHARSAAGPGSGHALCRSPPRPSRCGDKTAARTRPQWASLKRNQEAGRQRPSHHVSPCRQCRQCSVDAAVAAVAAVELVASWAAAH